MLPAVSPEPNSHAPYVARLIPGASRRAPRRWNGSIGAAGKIRAVEPLSKRAHTPNLRLQDLVLPSPMRPAGDNWSLISAVGSDYLAILTSWASARVLAEITVHAGFSSTDWRSTFRTLTYGDGFRSALTFAVITTLFAHSEGVYQPSGIHPEQIGALQITPLMKSVAWSSALVWFISGTSCPDAVFCSAVLLSLMSLLLARRLRPKLTSTDPRNKRNVLIVGAGPAGRAVATYLADHPETGRVFRGFLDCDTPSGFGVLGEPADLTRIARAEFIDEVIVAPSGHPGIGRSVIEQALRNHLDVKIVPDLLGAETESSFLENWGTTPLLSLHQERLPVARLLFKRILDVMISSFILVAVAPLMALIAVLIRLESRGPVLYTAPRVGRKGRRFRCYKFRTMKQFADKEREALRKRNQREGPCFKMADDPRVTRVGRMLRRYSLDELPQLWNVLRGEMSLVGPRPHPLDDVARYEIDHLPRLDVTPGLTGLWQVSARQSRSFQTNLALDLEYIQSWSLWMDLRILFKTLSVVVQGTGV